MQRQGSVARLRALLLVTTALGAVAATPAWAVMPSWTNPGAGDWFDPDNWDTGVPDNTTFQVNGGTARITNGGQAVSGGAFIGNSPTGNGAVEVTGLGSIWSLGSSSLQEVKGRGTLTVSNGGRVTAGSANLGFDVGSTGLVIVTGAGSSLSITGSLYVGLSGAATLAISDGARATSGLSVLGWQTDGVGAVTVDGVGSVWATAGDLYLGWNGEGTLDVSHGGWANTAGSAFIGTNAGGVGAVTVDGAGSSWTVGSDLDVGYFGSGTLTISNGGRVTSGEASIGGSMAGGNGVVIVDGVGSVWRNGDHMHLGGTGAGTLKISNGGAVDNDDDLDIGAGGMLDIGAGQGAGSFDADEVIFHGSSAQLVFSHTDANYIFSVRVRGDGSISQEGPGTTVLTGDDGQFTGTTNVDGGTLVVDTTLGGTTTLANAGTLVVDRDGTLTSDVYVGGRLEGSGQTAYTRLYNGGTIAPGRNSVGTLTVAGDLDVDLGATYEADISGGASDRIDVTGNANLTATTLNLVRHPTALGRYTILTAGGTIAGTFDQINSDYLFITPTLDYSDTQKVDVVLARNGVAFADVAASPTQASVAAAVDALGAGNTLYDAVVGLDETEAQSAFDELAGGPSPTQGADIQAAGLVSNILTGRIDQAFDAVGGDGPRINEYVASGPGVVTDPAAPTNGVWGQVYGAYGSVASGGGAAGTQSVTGGLAMGLDGQLGTWRVGVVVQSGATSAAMPDANTTSTSADYGAGLYAGTEFGDTRLAVGTTFTRHSVSSSRHVVLPGVDETLSASYAAGTAQAFARLSHEFDLGATSLTPYASLQYVANSTDGYTETGGAAALTVAPDLISATFTTLGFDASHQFRVGDDKLLTAEGGIGWRHAFAATPSAVHSLAGGTSFSVLGGPIASDIAVLNAGLTLDVSDTTTFNLSYDGQLGAGMQTHGLKATWNGKF